MTGTEDRIEVPSSDGISEQASRNTLALNPLVGITGQDLVDSANVLFKAIVNEPKVAAEQWLSFLGELAAIVGGKSERAPRAGDKRFSDPTWKESGLHSGLLKAYLAWGEAVSGLVDKTSLSNVDKARAHLITEILIDAVAPTNAMLTNPAAVRKFVDTGGRSLWQGLQNYFDDLTKNRGMPSMVDTSAFKVGENLATTPGAVVFRNELLELIQYAPPTAKVWKRPLVVTPPQINKYYALYLSPDKSMRTEAARIGGVGLQIIRDWVMRFNARGAAGLLDGKSPGQPSKLNDVQRQAMVRMIESGPIAAIHGVVRWRLIDLSQWIYEE